MINCEHVIFQRLISLFFTICVFKQTIPNKRNPESRNYVRKISVTLEATIVQRICLS